MYYEGNVERAISQIVEGIYQKKPASPRSPPPYKQKPTQIEEIIWSQVFSNAAKPQTNDNEFSGWGNLRIGENTQEKPKETLQAKPVQVKQQPPTDTNKTQKEGRVNKNKKNSG